MKNYIIFFIYISFMSCKNDDLVCCSSKPPTYGLYLCILQNTVEAKNILSSNNEINNDKVYYYREVNGEQKKIKTYNYKQDISLSNGTNSKVYIIYSYSNSIYDPIIDKGLSTIYLQKLNNDTDTIQIDVSKLSEKKRTKYVLNKIRINGKTPTIFQKCDYDGYCFYLI